MGGKSAEHNVSLASGNQVLKHLDCEKYIPSKLVIKKDGSFDFSISDLKNLDIVFIALHGPGGEDGVIQGFLESLGIKYTGSGVLASAIGMNKKVSKTIWKSKGLPIVPFRIVSSIANCERTNPPFVLKPASQGSSFGVSIVENKAQIEKAFKDAAASGNEVMLEPYIKGTEITVGVLGNEKPFALPVIEIVPKTKFFDYEAKYTPGMSEEIVPARISKLLTIQAQKLAIKAFTALGCRGFARVDMFIEKGKILLSEINTIPGLTKNSLLPKAAKASGISFSDLIDRIINLGFKQ